MRKAPKGALVEIEKWVQDNSEKFGTVDDRTFNDYILQLKARWIVDQVSKPTATKNS